MKQSTIDLVRYNGINISVTIDQLRSEANDIRNAPDTIENLEKLYAINQAIIKLNNIWSEIKALSTDLQRQFKL